jgi:ComF family protein
MGRGISPYHTVRRLGTFQGPLRNLIHLMKYQHRWGLAEQLADRLLAQRGVRDVIELADCLAPVPLHWWRQMTRGYNQSEVIARRLAERVGRVRVVRPAVRIKRTQTQTALTSHADREANMRDAFYLWRRRSIRGRHVVVVDDVMTSAATLRALGRVLREAEPASLNALVLAVADPRGRGFESI